MKRDVFQAIADPTRRAIIGLVALQAMTPNAMAEHFDTSRQAVSKHVQVLTDVGILEARQQGREIYYHFNPEKLVELEKWLEPYRMMWTDRFSQFDELLIKIKPLKNEKSDATDI
jgi:DNA-binding transcriptional ArsR family regulator